MDKPFEGRVAIITGGSDGIGRATARMLATRGATVIICARRKEKLDVAKAEIEAAGGIVETVSLDVSDSDADSSLRQGGRQRVAGLQTRAGGWGHAGARADADVWAAR